MAESLVVAAVKLLGLPALREVNRLRRFHRDFDYIMNKLCYVQGWLGVLERQCLERGVEADGIRMWLRRLRGVAYDIQDVLGDYENMSEEFHESTTMQKVKKLVSCSNPMLVKYTIANMINGLKQSLDTILDDPLIRNFSQLNAPVEMPTINECLIFPVQQEVVGREGDKSKILEILQRGKKHGTPILPIVGLGGVGKSTIANAIFSEAIGFDRKIWVTVTRNFSWESIARSILEEEGKSVTLPREHQSIKYLIENKLKNKKCMLVFDDLWSEIPDDLVQLKRIVKFAGAGSQAIVTTRSEDVGNLVCSDFTRPYKLDILPDIASWKLFSDRAFNKNNMQTNQKKTIGKEIVRKCGGLPLAILSLGSTMSSKTKISEWKEVQNSKLWDSKEAVAPSLNLSYYYMPPQWRLCFQYCAMFPKGFEFNKHNLIQQWVALGMVELHEADNYARGLMAIYFLQMSNISDQVEAGMNSKPEVLKRSNKPEVLRMHDMVHELAKSVTEDYLPVSITPEVSFAHNEYEPRRTAQLANYPKPEEESNDKIPPEKQPNDKIPQEKQLNSNCLPPKIRALRLTNCHIGFVPFKAAKYLRVLDVSGCSSGDYFPGSVCELKYLSYLDASSTSIKELTRKFTKLKNLLHLNLSNTSLEVLPSDFHKLRKLISLNLSCCRQLKELPDGLGESGTINFLDLSHCPKIQSLPQSISKLTKLKSFNLSNCERLKRLPELFGHLTLLEHLNLSGCSDLEQLPESFGHLPCLNLLDLSTCSQLQRLPETSNDGFIELEHLYLSGCPLLKKLPLDNSQSLQTLDLVDCYNLEDGPQVFPRSLMNLDISNCQNMKMNDSSFTHLDDLKILRLKSCQVNNSIVDSLGSRTNLEYLDLSATKLRKIPESFRNLKKLHTLVLFGDQLFSIYQDKCLSKETIDNMTSLKKVWVLDPVLASKVPVHLRGDSVTQLVNEIKQNSVYLKISDLSASNGEEIARRNNIQQKSDVTSLNLNWRTSNNESSVGDTGNEAVLQKLQPHQNLQSFTLDNYPGAGFPSWIMEIGSVLPNLKTIGLNGLKNCNSLPPFGQLPNLEALIISNMPMLKKVTMDICAENSRPFRKLVVLILVFLANLEEWHTSNSTNGVVQYMFPVLWNLKVEHCPKLSFSPSIPKCSEYSIVGSSRVLEKMVDSSSIHAELSGPLTCQSPLMLGIKGGHISSNGLVLLQSLRTLRELEFFPDISDELPESVRSLINLKRLHISNCKELPDWLGDLAKLEILTIERCSFVRPLRQSLQRLTALETLVITSCSGLLSESIPSVSSLRGIVIRVCKDLKTLPLWLGEARSLELLHIIDCPYLDSTPKGLHNLEASGVLKISTSNREEETINFLKTGWMNQMYTPIASHYSEDSDNERRFLMNLMRSYSRGEGGTSANGIRNNQEHDDNTSLPTNQMFGRSSSSNRMGEGTSADGGRATEDSDFLMDLLIGKMLTRAYSRREEGTSADGGRRSQEHDDNTSLLTNQMFGRSPSSSRMGEGTSADGGRATEDVMLGNLLVNLLVGKMLTRAHSRREEGASANWGCIQEHDNNASFPMSQIFGRSTSSRRMDEGTSADGGHSSLMYTRAQSHREEGTSTNGGRNNQNNDNNTSFPINQIFQRLPSSRRMGESTSSDVGRAREEEDNNVMMDDLLTRLMIYAILQGSPRE